VLSRTLHRGIENILQGSNSTRDKRMSTEWRQTSRHRMDQPVLVHNEHAMRWRENTRTTKTTQLNKWHINHWKTLNFVLFVSVLALYSSMELNGFTFCCSLSWFYLKHNTEQFSLKQLSNVGTNQKYFCWNHIDSRFFTGLCHVVFSIVLVIKNQEPN
jgi:hypothetical protein